MSIRILSMTRSVSLRPHRVEAITSLRVEENEAKRILTALGFNSACRT